MAGLPPMSGPPGQAPGRPPLSIVPPGGPPPPLPGGPVPPPSAPPPMAAGGGLGPQSPFASLLIDLPSHLGTGWQSVDIAVSALKIALRSRDFQETPAVVATVQSCIEQLDTLVTTYTEGTTGGPSTPTYSPAMASQAPGAADADAQPAAADSGGAAMGGEGE